MRTLTRLPLLLRRLLQAGLLCGLSVPLAAGAAEPGRILLLLSETHAPYQRFREAFEQNLPPGAQLEVSDLTQQDDATAQADLLVTVGTKAARRALAQSRSPVLATMLSSRDFERMQAERHTSMPFSALYLDQPLPRQVALIRAVLPARTRVGVLYADPAVFSPEPIRDELRQQGAQLVALKRREGHSLATDLEALLGQSEILLAVPDGEIYNASTIRNILLGSYRRNVPLIGLSEAYVNAGALCAVFSTPQQQAAQAAGMVADFLRTRRMAPAQFPQLYEVALNTAVARTLRLDVRSTEALRIEIERMTGQTP